MPPHYVEKKLDRARKTLNQIGIAIAMVAASFFGTIGAATVFFDRPLGTFAPGSSSDIASWVQAIGAILAIVYSYRLGARQLNQSTQSERRAEEARIQELAGRRYEVRQAYQDAVRIASFLASTGGKYIAEIWRSNFSDELDAALKKMEEIATTGFTTNQISQLRALARQTRSIRASANSYYGPDYSALDSAEYRERATRFQDNLRELIPRLHEAYGSFFLK